MHSTRIRRENYHFTYQSVFWHILVGARDHPDFNFFCYADGEGLFEPVARLGTEVNKGDLAGYVHTPETPGSGPEPMYFDAGGVVVCQRIPGRIMRGDCLYHLGCDF